MPPVTRPPTPPSPEAPLPLSRARLSTSRRRTHFLLPVCRRSSYIQSSPIPTPTLPPSRYFLRFSLATRTCSSLSFCLFGCYRHEHRCERIRLVPSLRRLTAGFGFLAESETGQGTRDNNPAPGRSVASPPRHRPRQRVYKATCSDLAAG